jgi:hypothetical protein
MLPREVQSEHWPDRATFDFPTRPIGPLRLIGLAPMAFALVFAWVPARFMLDFFHGASRESGNNFNWFLLVFLLGFIATAMTPFAIGLFILAGRTRLVVAGDRVSATQIAGPFRWSRKVRFADIERLEVAAIMAKSESVPAVPALGQLGALMAILREGKKAALLVGYPRDWLEGMAAELSGLMQLQGKTVPVTQAAALSRSTNVSAEAPIEKPADSLATLVATANGIELSVPSPGLWKGSQGLLAFGIIWCVVLGLITTGFALGARQTTSRNSLGPLGTALILAGFWGIGAGTVLGGIHLGTRRWSLHADPQRLHIALQSALRFREWQWPAPDIREIKVGDSGVTVNNRRLEQLQIHPRAGHKTGLLTGRNHAELGWIATVLRQALRLPAVASAGNSLDG